MLESTLVPIAARARLEPSAYHFARRRPEGEGLPLLELPVSIVELVFWVFTFSPAPSAAVAPALALAASFSLFGLRELRAKLAVFLLLPLEGALEAAPTVAIISTGAGPTVWPLT